MNFLPIPLLLLFACALAAMLPETNSQVDSSALDTAQDQHLKMADVKRSQKKYSLKWTPIRKIGVFK